MRLTMLLCIQYVQQHFFHRNVNIMDHQPCKHEPKSCPRCQHLFECKPGDIGNCQCQGIPLAVATKEFIAKKYQDCLCRQCLLELNNQPILFKEKFGNHLH